MSFSSAFFIDRQSQFYKFEFLKISLGYNFGRTALDWEVLYNQKEEWVYYGIRKRNTRTLY